MESTAHPLNRDDDATAREQPTAVHPTIVSAGRETCSNCGAAMAADQRYCVECGQRHGAPRFPFMEGVAQHSYEMQAPVAVARPRLMTANGTLIAGIGTLLLAMGIGVLIGRTGNNGSNARANNPVQVLTVGGGVAGGATGAAGSATASAPTSTPATSKAALAAGAKTAKATHTSTTGAFKTKAPPPKVVSVGSRGSGRGYTNGKFTGNFFGP